MVETSDTPRSIETTGTPFSAYVSRHLSDQIRDCIQSCIECHQICEQMVRHCLEMGGLHADPVHIRLLQDCAQITAVAADFMLRESGLFARVCAVCAEVCQSCADDCELMPDDEAMQICAEVCRRCAEACERLFTHH